MRLIALLALLLPSLALAQVTIGPGAHTGPRILGEASTEYCPMQTHGKCTDGKTITTTRSTPVPCGSGTAGVDVGCYQGGLEAWGQVVNYARTSNTFSSWTKTGTAVVTGPVNEWWTITTTEWGGAYRDLTSYLPSLAGKQVTASCYMRGASGVRARLRLNLTGATGFYCDATLPCPDDRCVCTGTIPAGATAANIEVGPALSSGDVQAAQCQVEVSPTPGRRCDAGATPATCDGDTHRVSTAGWPTTSGRIDLVYASDSTGAHASLYLLDSRVSNSGSGIYLYRASATGALVFGLRSGAVASALSSAGLTWVSGQSYTISVRWNAARVDVYRDGTKVTTWAPTVVPDAHRAMAILGNDIFGGSSLQGRISRLEWSNQ